MHVQDNDKSMSNDSNGGGGVAGSGIWTPDNKASKCMGCNREFNITRRKVWCIVK